MTIYQITSKAGAEYGPREADSAAAALYQVHQDAGCGDRVQLRDDHLIFADDEARSLFGDVEDWDIDETPATPIEDDAGACGRAGCAGYKPDGNHGLAF